MLTRHRSYLKKIFQRLECQYKYSFQQVEVLNERYLALVMRYRRALGQHQMGLAYSIYLRLQVVEEVRLAYYGYTKQKAGVLTRMREEMLNNDDYFYDDVIQDELEDDRIMAIRD